MINCQYIDNDLKRCSKPQIQDSCFCSEEHFNMSKAETDEAIRQWNKLPLSERKRLKAPDLNFKYKTYLKSKHA